MSDMSSDLSETAMFKKGILFCAATCVRQRSATTQDPLSRQRFSINTT